MPLRVAIHNAARRYPASITDRIEAYIKKAEAAVAAHAEIPVIDVAVFLSNHNMHPNWFATGVMMAQDSFHLTVNPSHTNFDRMSEERIFSVVVHELHHCLRGAYFKFETLADTVIFEGMAIAAEDHLGCLDEYWQRLKRPTLRALKPRLLRVAQSPDNPEFDWVHWPIRGHDVSIKYFLGERILSSWFASTEHTPFSALAVPARQIVAEAPVTCDVL